MIRASLRGNGLLRNDIFDLSSPGNRDNCFEPYVKLRQAFAERGIALDTSDLNENQTVSFELHQDVQSENRGACAYLMLFETPFVKPGNWREERWAGYRRIFTWDDSRVDGERFVKLNFPNPIRITDPDGYAARPRLCCLIAGNKAAAVDDARELYSERVAAIRWYECHAPDDFDLYGVDWELPAPRPGLLGKIEKRLWRKLPGLRPKRPFPSYRGRVDSKHRVLSGSRFSICYENVRDLPGYITEKLFDCFFAGCVPVYWGASNIASHVPGDCFIDRRDFRDMAEVHAYLRNMGEAEYLGYQQRIAGFLRSGAARPFGTDAFVETLVATIARDLG